MRADRAGGLPRVVSPVRAMHLAAGFLAATIAAGCGHTAELSQDITVHEEITPQPVHVGDAIVSLRLSDRTAAPIANAVIMLEAEMNHPGMAPLFKTATETAPGQYQASIPFNMAGDWVVSLHIKLADGRKVERQIDVRGVQPH